MFVLLLINCTVSKGQIYKYIGLEDGLNNQKIYHIQKDRRGYMWFLTQEGIDRYDGKHIKHYNFSDDNMTLDSRIALNWLYMDNDSPRHFSCYEYHFRLFLGMIRSMTSLNWLMCIRN